MFAIFFNMMRRTFEDKNLENSTKFLFISQEFVFLQAIQYTTHTQLTIITNLIKLTCSMNSKKKYLLLCVYMHV